MLNVVRCMKYMYAAWSYVEIPPFRLLKYWPSGNVPRHNPSLTLCFLLTSATTNPGVLTATRRSQLDIPFILLTRKSDM